MVRSSLCVHIDSTALSLGSFSPVGDELGIQQSTQHEEMHAIGLWFSGDRAKVLTSKLPSLNLLGTKQLLNIASLGIT